ncbi:hypothetical protein [Serratia quinivorans]|uniref:hypothetical protein n=1 Tax=Serratia quinivorans TaxID=137545 RepID=UPI0021793D03|nr:hypothetical protein [Serratia quinivorans]CAI0911343.1 Uncharacterised protein [Serratia quinivorans]
MTKTLTTELLSVARAMRDYIDALPSDVVASLPTMPGFDRDWADEVIEAANREAVPVIAAWQHKGEPWRIILDRDIEEVRKHSGSWNPLYTAPPAPAVPDISALTDLIVDRLIDCSAADDDSIADAETFVYNACRAAMLAQPVSQGGKLPEGFKLMPIEMTDEIAEAIALEARCCGGIALCIYEAALAAAPEGGNG